MITLGDCLFKLLGHFLIVRVENTRSTLERLCSSPRRHTRYVYVLTDQGATIIVCEALVKQIDQDSLYLLRVRCI